MTTQTPITIVENEGDSTADHVKREASAEMKEEESEPMKKKPSLANGVDDGEYMRRLDHGKHPTLV